MNCKGKEGVKEIFQSSRIQNGFEACRTWEAYPESQKEETMSPMEEGRGWPTNWTEVEAGLAFEQ